MEDEGTRARERRRGRCKKDVGKRKLNFPENRDHLKEETEKENQRGLASAWEEGSRGKGEGGREKRGTYDSRS